MAVDDQLAAPGSGCRRTSPLLTLLALLLVVLFAGLGTWQVVRLQWKLDLIARVDARVHAAPVPVPAATRWAQVTPASDEYRHVSLRGAYLYDLTTPVQALTDEGSGYWLLTPLCMTDGTLVLVNRGFIPSELGARTRYAPRRAHGNPCAAAGPAVALSGLLRTNDHGGPFSRANDPANERWYTRDVPAILRARGLDGAVPAAPFFVDVAANQNAADAPDRPIGGLTVVRFANSHLMYAITWYALALMVAGAWWWVLRGAAHEGEPGDERDD
jgi:surfeit locus 1 family protein